MPISSIHFIEDTRRIFKPADKPQLIQRNMGCGWTGLKFLNGRKKTWQWEYCFVFLVGAQRLPQATGTIHPVIIYTWRCN